MLKKLFSHTLLYALGPQIPKIANILLLPIITQYLTPLDYGVYGTTMAYNGLLGGISTLGLDTLLVNSYYKKNKHWKLYWKRYYGLLFLWQNLYIVIYAIILFFVLPNEVGDNKLFLVALILIPNYLFSIINTLGGRYLQIAQKPQRIFITTTLTGTITILVNYFCIVNLGLGYIGWYISGAIGAFVLFCSYGWPILIQLKLFPILNLKKKFIKETLKISLPYVPHNYSSYLLSTSDRLVMDQYSVDINNIGKYNMAYIIGSYFEIFGMAAGMAIGPSITKLYSKENKESEYQVRTLVYFLQLIFLMLSFTASLWAKEIFNLLISNKKLSGVYYLGIIIIMGYSYRPMYWAAINKLLYIEKTNQLWKVSFVGGGINVVLNLVFIPIYGFKAAAITTFIGLLYIGFSGFFLKDYKNNSTVKYYPITWILIILSSTFLVFLLKDIDVLHKFSLTLFIFTGFTFYFFKNKKKINNIEL